MLALNQDTKANRPVEAREHVRRFHELFFTIAPDKAAIEGNVKRALMLADKTNYNYYKNLMEKGYYSRMISGNIHQRIELDSIRCDFEAYPYRGVFDLYRCIRIIQSDKATAILCGCSSRRLFSGGRLRYRHRRPY